MPITGAYSLWKWRNCIVLVNDKISASCQTNNYVTKFQMLLTTKRELWITVRLNYKFSKTTILLQSISIFFKFVHLYLLLCLPCHLYVLLTFSAVPTVWLLQRNSLYHAVCFANFRFSVPSIILADLLGNICLLAWVQKIMVCDSWVVNFKPFCLFQVSRFVALWLSYFGPNNRLVKFALQIFFLIFLSLFKWCSIICSWKNVQIIFVSFTSVEGTPLFRGKETSIQCLPPSFDKKSTHHRDFLFSAELSEHITMWFALTPPSQKRLTEQIKPKSLRSLQCAQRNTTNFAVINFVTQPL